jgi:WD40 repeat protein
VIVCTAAEVDLNDMPYAQGAKFDPNRECLLGTRERIINDITDWVNSTDAPHICLLTGVAGSGKSSIAMSVARLFDEVGRLGSSFCFDRSHAAERRPNNVFSTIARDLADLDAQRKSALWQVVQGRRAVRTTHAIAEQFDKFILLPAADLMAIGPILIVIDALDESGDRVAREGLLSTLGQGISKLPPNFRIFVTSRAEADIQDMFDNRQDVLHMRMDTIDQRSTDDDISLFVRSRLSKVKRLDQSLCTEWCHQLVKKAEGLFQWASTACLFIATALDPHKRLNAILSLAPQSDQQGFLDNLYHTILKDLLRLETETSISCFKHALGIALSVMEPLPLASLERLSQNIDGPSMEILCPLGSLLTGVTGDLAPVRPLHTSFHDFLTNKERGKEFFICTSAQDKNLALASLRAMRGLQFNICHLETSYLGNSQIHNLAERTSKAIHPHLSYSCRVFAVHLQATTFDDVICREVEEFLSKQLLYWLEVLSLIKHVNIATQALSVVCQWLEVKYYHPSRVQELIYSSQTHNDQLAALAADAKKFVNAFGSPISQSAPHIYLSALPFAPIKSLVSRTFLPKFSNTLSVTAGKAVGWPVIQYVLEGHIDGVSSVAFSPNGKHIVSGSRDNTIYVWDAVTEEVVSGPLKGHTSFVNSVAFSPDGKHIVSGSTDKTIYVWDTVTGEVVSGPFKGHTDWVTSVAFSPDGKHIVSGSNDNTICVWDAVTGEVVSGPLKGHTSIVNSVAFSPDGKHIASGSNDNTICVWDAVTGQVVSGPLKGHTSGVNSVAFSPDGKRIASGSGDKTVCVWDAVTGEVVSGPLKGHTSGVNSVAFSPDGKHIASGSGDKRICVWDAITGEVVSGPLKGHTSFVNSVAFSPDGKHIVSGSNDKTTCVWNAVTGEVAFGPLKFYTDWVTSVAFSPDGKHIVSGSDDNTICVWDAVTGEVVSGPLKGHTSIVNSVAFSPDGKHIASGSNDNTICVWDEVTGEVVLGPLKGHTGNVNSVAFSPDGKHIVSGSSDKTICLWDAVTGQVVTGPLNGHTGWVNSVALSLHSKHIVSGSTDKTICVWDAVTGDVVSGPLKGHTDWVTSVAFSPDGKHIVSGSGDKTICVWDAVTGQVVSGPLNGHTGWVTSVAFSPDGKHIVSGSTDKTICVLDAVTGEVVCGPLEGHTRNVSSVAFSPDGKHIVSGSGDSTIQVWDAVPAENFSGALEGCTGDTQPVSYRQHIVSGSHNMTIQSLNAATEAIFSGLLDDHIRYARHILFLPNSNYPH